MKRIIALLMAVCMMFAFAACGADVPDANKSDDSDAATANTDAKTSYSDLGISIELTSEEYGIGFRKGSDLTAEVNKIMNEMVADNSLAVLAEKYQLTLSESEPLENEAATIDDLEYIKANGKMIIGITDYAPMNFKDDNGNWTGFDTEFAQAVCEKLGVTAEFVEIDWDNKFIALESKVIDCIWNGMTISEDVLKNTSCSKAYVKNAQVVVMSDDKISEYVNAASMKDLTFAVEAGSAGKDAAEENGFKFIEVGTQTDALLEVQSGSCDACVIDLTMANAMVGE